MAMGALAWFVLGRLNGASALHSSSTRQKAVARSGMYVWAVKTQVPGTGTGETKGREY